MRSPGISATAAAIPFFPWVPSVFFFCVCVHPTWPTGTVSYLPGSVINSWTDFNSTFCQAHYFIIHFFPTMTEYWLAGIATSDSKLQSLVYDILPSTDWLTVIFMAKPCSNSESELRGCVCVCVCMCVCVCYWSCHPKNKKAQIWIQINICWKLKSTTVLLLEWWWFPPNIWVACLIFPMKIATNNKEY